MAMLADTVDGVIGVDTHRDTLAAAALTPVGGVLAQTTTRADAAGYQQLLGFARGQVPGRRGWAVEGAGSYGAGLAAFGQQRGERVVEVGRPKRPARRTGARATPWTRSAPRPRGTWPPAPGQVRGVAASGKPCGRC
jgi:transposase